MEHYITKIRIEKVRHLSNIDIEIDSSRRMHLLLTGKNGSGKTSVLQAIKSYLKAINDGKLASIERTYPNWIKEAEQKILFCEWSIIG